jgi:electron transport complex protein RnfB
MSGESIQTRREFLRGLARNALLAGLASLGALSLARRGPGGRKCSGNGDACRRCPDAAGCPRLPKPAPRRVWQLDPSKCIQCGRCATHCVLQPSAVRCVHRFERCGYCRLCFGFFQPGATALNSGAENQLCPTDAIRRTFVEEPYYEYTIDESRCIGCGRCVKHCAAFGNGSLVLQVRQDVCVRCNDCAIARNCPAEAFRQVPAAAPYWLDPKAGGVGL